MTSAATVRAAPASSTAVGLVPRAASIAKAVTGTRLRKSAAFDGPRRTTPAFHARTPTTAPKTIT